MKRTQIITLALLLGLLLSLSAACGGKAPEEEPQTTEPTAPSTTAIRPTEPQATEYRVVLPGEGAQHITVSPEVPQRWHRQITQQLVADTGYGTLYPYIGNVNEYWGGEFEPVYGFCTADGVQVSDPWYNVVRVVNHQGESLYWCEKYLGFGEDWQVQSAITLSTLDGSRVTHWDAAMTVSRYYGTYIRSHPYSWEPESPYITVCRGDRWGLIDYTLNEILPCEYPNPLFFGDGLAPILEGENRYYYIDLDGNPALGPYEVPPDYDPYMYFAAVLDTFCPFVEAVIFNEGRAVFSQNGQWGLIDRQGQVVLPPAYDFIGPFYRGFAAVSTPEGDRTLIGRDGSAAVPAMKNGYLYCTGQGWVVEGEHDKRIYFSYEGKVLPEDTPMGYDIGDGAFAIDREEGLTDIYIDGALAATWETSRPMEYLGDGLIFSHGTGVIDLAGNVIISLSSGYAGLSDGLIVTSYWLEGEAYRRNDVHDKSGRLIADSLCAVTVYGDCIAAARGTWGGVMNRQGEWIFKASILGSLPD